MDTNNFVNLRQVQVQNYLWGVVLSSTGQEIQEGSLQMLLKEVVLVLLPLPAAPPATRWEA